MLTVATPCWLSPQRPLLTGFSESWIRQLELLVVPGNSTAARHVCSTLNYTGWMSLNEFSINWEWWSTGAYEARLRSTWWNAALLRRILPVVSVSDPLPAISWTYHDIAAAGLDVEHSPLQVQGPETCCLTISVIHHLASTLSDQRRKLTSSQCTGTRSAVEASCVMRFTNQQSSSSSSSSLEMFLDRK